MEIQKIPEDAELVIFDYCNTLLVCPNGNPMLRDKAFGLIARLRLKRKKSAISSTSLLKDILDCPEFLQILPFISGVYGEEHTFEEEGRKYKDLGLICEELKVGPEKSVLIGDNYNDIDRMSAERFKIPLIIVPDGSSAPDYDLLSLIN